MRSLIVTLQLEASHWFIKAMLTDALHNTNTVKFIHGHDQVHRDIAPVLNSLVLAFLNFLLISWTNLVWLFSQ